jgi:Glucodextranase, domain B
VSRTRVLLGVAMVSASVVVAGCGSSSTVSSGPPKVQVLLTAPTDGVTVIQSRLAVIGTVSPRNAVLRISGRRVSTQHGTFLHPVTIHKGLNHLRIDASAPGFVASSTVVAVRYKPERTPASGSPSGAPSDGIPGLEAQAEASCSESSGGNVGYCTCAIRRMFKAGYNTEAKWRGLVISWRRSFFANGTISYPPAVRAAIIYCVKANGA